jgi:hypothetical protein
VPVDSVLEAPAGERRAFRQATSPVPDPGISGEPAARTGVGFGTSTVKPPPGAPATRKSTRADGACLRALVSASWTIRKA